MFTYFKSLAFWYGNNDPNFSLQIVNTKNKTEKKRDFMWMLLFILWIE